jgi:hypothetical protein
MNQNGAENGRLPALFGLKIAKNAVFCLKVLNKIYSQDIFREIRSYKKFPISIPVSILL